MSDGDKPMKLPVLTELGDFGIEHGFHGLLGGRGILNSYR